MFDDVTVGVPASTPTEIINMIAKRAIWDTAISPELFLAIVRGEESCDWPSRAFCVARLLECASWYDVVKIITPREICSLWPDAERYVRTAGIKRGMEYACRVLQ
ncbi:MAG: hypothetical protein WCK54_09505 [Desulfuromonadales bacterium]